MSDTLWQTTKQRGIPCGSCGKIGTCTVSPDGNAFKCWPKGGKVVQCGGGNGNGTGYIGAVRRPKPTAGDRGKVFPTARRAIEAAGRWVKGGTLGTTWRYTDVAGAAVMRVARFDLPGGRKEFRPVHRVKDGWKIGDPPGPLPLPLYRLTKIPATGTVFITEGEKACDAARSIGLAAVTSAHGSSGAKKSDWTSLAGRDVVILPDNDDPGRKYARDVAAILAKLDPPARTKIVALPDLPATGDVVEYIKAQDSMDTDAIASSIIALVEAAQWVEASDVAVNAEGEPWPDPLPLPAGLPPVLPFDFDLLPVALHRWIKDISARMQCPPDYCAATAVIVAGALIGRKVAIRPKHYDDWQVVPNLFGMSVGRPSLMKSPAMKEMLKFLGRLEVDAKAECAKALAEYEAAALVADATKKVRKDELKKAVRDGGDAQAIADNMASEAADPPTRKRYLVNDTTVEKLGMILAENPNGVLLFVDELVSLLRTMEREGHEGDRGFYLTAWAGDSRYTYDRIGRGTLDIEAALVSIVGSIQPGVLADYLRGAVNGGRGDDGLIQRFQIAVFPDAPATWTNVDRCPAAVAKSTAHAALQRLADLTADAVQAERDNLDREAVPFLRFDDAAQSEFDKWHAGLETRLRNGSEHPAIESHLAKYRSLIPSLALIVHLLDGGVGPVSAVAIGKAIGWGRYLESHARRIYAGITEAPAVAARALGARIQKGDVSGLFAARDVYINGWTGLDRELTASAIDVLLSLHWLEERIEPTAGRTRTRYAVNPKIGISPKGGPTKLSEAPFVGNVGSDPSDIPNYGGVERQRQRCRKRRRK